MDKKSIETLAISAVRDSIAMTGVLDQYIHDNDKEPSWDGHIYIYSGKNKKNNNMTGRVSVQVKGKVKGNLEKDEIKESVRVSDLKHYLNDGGVVYFVVYISEDAKQRRIYYAELLPVKLRGILDEAGSQASITIKFKSFPEDDEKKVGIILNFYDNSKKQHSFSSACLYALNDLGKGSHIDVDKVYIPFIKYGHDHRNYIRQLFEHEFYLYAISKGSLIPQPLKDIIDGETLVVRQEVIRPVIINGAVYYDSYYCIHSKNEISINIGQSLILTFNSLCKSKYHISYKNSNMLRVLVKDIGFYLAVIESRCFRLGDNLFEIDLDGNSYINFPLETAKRLYEFSVKAEKLLDMFSIQGDLDLSSLDDHSYKNLIILIKTIIDREAIENQKKDLQLVSSMRIGNMRVLLKCIPVEGKAGSYIIRDFFEEDMDVLCELPDGTSIQTSQCAILKVEDYLEIVNIRYNSILPSFKKFPNNSNSDEITSHTMLNMISAYDACGGSKPILLETAKDISRWLLDISASDDAAIRTLNWLQIICRERSLNSDEVQLLENIFEESNKNDVKAAACLLLDEQAKAEKYYRKMSVEEQQNFKEYPIFRFWKGRVILEK